MRADLLKGHLDLLLLAILEQGPLHGYAISDELRQRSDGSFDLPEGTIYPALHRLEAAGYLQSGWSSASGRRRREYELSGAGRAALAQRHQEWRQFSGAIDSVIRRTPWTNPA
ncbi:MAG: helix-turn-helix transcriptional regulator [Tepidiformaceae bacterium]